MLDDILDSTFVEAEFVGEQVQIAAVRVAEIRPYQRIIGAQVSGELGERKTFRLQITVDPQPRVDRSRGRAGGDGLAGGVDDQHVALRAACDVGGHRPE